MGAKTCTSPLDGLIAELAATQHGVVCRTQLLQLAARRAIGHRIQAGRLHRIHRGVYAVGYERLTQEGRRLAAVLAIGADTALSHRAAGANWQIRPYSGRPEVTTTRRVGSRPAILVHRGPLPPDEVTVEDGIPTTTVPRTILDLASVLTPRQVERAMEEAEHLGLTDSLSLIDLLERYPRRRGTAVIRTILEAGELGDTFTRSDLEEAFLAFIRTNSIPRPEMNLDIELSPGRWVEADCVWRAQRVVAELDSRRFHATPQAFERDRAKDRALSAAGWRPIRITWKQIADDGERLVADLRKLVTA